MPNKLKKSNSNQALEDKEILSDSGQDSLSKGNDAFSLYDR